MADIILNEFAQFDQNIVIPDNTKPLTQSELATMILPLANRTRYNLNKLNNSPYFTLRNGSYQTPGVSVSANGVGITIDAYGASNVLAYEFAFTYVPPYSANVVNGSFVKTRCRFSIASTGSVIGDHAILYDFGVYQRNGSTFGTAMHSAVINLIDANAVIFEAECVSTFNNVINVGIVVLKSIPSLTLFSLALQSFDVEIY